MRILLTVLGRPDAAHGWRVGVPGLNLLPGSFMTGNIKWAVYGAILAVAGVALIIWSRRKPLP